MRVHQRYPVGHRRRHGRRAAHNSHVRVPGTSGQAEASVSSLVAGMGHRCRLDRPRGSAATAERAACSSECARTVDLGTAASMPGGAGISASCDNDVSVLASPDGERPR